MKTAIQELLDKVNDMSSNNKEIIKMYIKSFIEKEKQQIIDAFELGNDLGQKGRLPSGEGYYQKTFGDELYKIIATDNFNRETVSDELIESGLEKTVAEDKLKKLQERESASYPWIYKAVPMSYKLFDAHRDLP